MIEEVVSEKEFMLKFKGLNFLVPKKTNCFWPYYGICLTGEYDRLLNNMRNSDIVLDAGASIGFFAVVASQRAKKVIAIEPQPENYSYLVRNIKLNHLKNVIPVNEALSDYVGNGYISGKGITATLSSKKGTSVKVTTINALLNRLSLDKFDIIKMDIEGSETKALKGKFIYGVRELSIETHGMKNYKKCKKWLEKENFTVQDWRFSWMTTFKKVIRHFKDFVVSEINVGLWGTRQVLKYFLGLSEEPILKADPRSTLKIIIASRVKD